MKREEFGLVEKEVVPDVLGVSVEIDGEEGDDEHHQQDHYDDLFDGKLGQNFSDFGLFLNSFFQFILIKIN